jgi:hypothetical protein
MDRELGAHQADAAADGVDQHGVAHTPHRP